MTPTSATPTTVLERYKITKLSKGETPYHREPDGDYVSNRMPVYVQRVDGKPDNVSLKPAHGYVRLLNRDEVEAVERVAERREWTLDVRRADIVIERYPNLDGDLDCNVDLLRALQKCAAELGVTIFLRSGRRTLAEQWALYNQLGPAIAAYPSPTAPHVRGVAADCGINGRDIGEHPGARAAMRKHGLCLRVPGEDWHVELGTGWAA